MFVRRSLVATALAPLVLGLGLSGCQEAEPTPKMPETTGSPTSTPTESPTAEQESPEDFIRRWAKASLDAQNSGDTNPYRALTTGCSPCESFADQVDDIYGSGGSIAVDRLAVRTVSKTDVPGMFTVVRMSGRTTVADAEGAKTQEFPGGREVLTVSLKKSADGWNVADFVRAAS